MAMVSHSQNGTGFHSYEDKKIFRIVLIEPEIPQNTGNILRLAANTDIEVLLVGRLGFSLTDKYLKRSAMDYIDHVNYKIIHSLDEYLDTCKNVKCISTHGTKLYTDIKLASDIFDLVFGAESCGLPAKFYEKFHDELYRIPMNAQARSLNLASSVAIVAYHILSLDNFKFLK